MPSYSRGCSRVHFSKSYCFDQSCLCVCVCLCVMNIPSEMYFFLSLGNYIQFIIVSDFLLFFSFDVQFSVAHTRLYAMKNDSIKSYCSGYGCSRHIYNSFLCRFFFHQDLIGAMPHFSLLIISNSFWFVCIRQKLFFFFTMFHMFFVFSLVSNNANNIQCNHQICSFKFLIRISSFMRLRITISI